MSVTRTGWFRTLALAAGTALVSAALATAQAIAVEELDDQRPEAWAMRWFAGVAMPTGFGAGEALTAGAVEIGFEAGWVPSLSEEERRVGFNGTKVEDLDRTPVFGRPVVRVGLGGGFSASAGWVPPIEMDGATANLLSLAVDRPLLETPRFRLGGRVFYLSGSITGDITCPAHEAAAGNDPVANPFGCEAPSDDEMKLESVGLELSAAWKLPAEALELYASALGQRLYADFQVDAVYHGFHDRGRLAHRGSDVAATLGLAYRWTERTRVAGEIFWSPLDLVRDPFGRGPSERRDLVNVRLLATYRLR